MYVFRAANFRNYNGCKSAIRELIVSFNAISFRFKKKLLLTLVNVNTMAHYDATTKPIEFGWPLFLCRLVRFKKYIYVNVCCVTDSRFFANECFRFASRSQFATATRQQQKSYILRTICQTDNENNVKQKAERERE